MKNLTPDSAATSHPRANQISVEIFPLFVALYVTGFMMEMLERWRFPEWTAAGVALSILTIVFAKNRGVFLVFLVLTTAYFVLLRFPEVANHINLLIACNILLILGLAYSYVSPRGRRDFSSYFDTLLSPMRLMLIVTYFVAGFHKFNYDFLNPEVSCIGRFLLRFLAAMMRPLFDDSQLSVIPVAFVVYVIGMLVAVLLLRRRLPELPRWLWFIGLVGLAAFGGLLVIWGFFVVEVYFLIESRIHQIVVGIAALIVFWQMIEGPSLLIPRIQYIFLCFALLFHTYLGMIGFVDFQTLAMALLLTFVPKQVLAAWGARRRFRLGSLEFDRVHVYVGLNLLAGALTGIHLLLVPIFEPRSLRAMQGLLFNGGVLILIWPILADLMGRAREWRWRGVSVFDRRAPKFLYLLPVLLLLFGMTSHLGLRTAGNFSMFSNLRTEGADSNHVLLANNPLKIWDYQEDIVRVIELDPIKADTGSHYVPRNLQGHALPMVEFRKAIATWASKGMVVPIVFEYQGEVVASDNIAADPAWRPSGWDWEMLLLDFRKIQLSGPNRCRW